MWPIRVRAAGQGTVFGLSVLNGPKQGIKF